MCVRALFILMAGLAISHAEKPVVYNPVDGEETARSKATVAALKEKYSVVEIPKNSDLVGPQFAGGDIPRIARASDGRFIGGDVSVGCVITDQGKVTDVVIEKSSDKRLDAQVAPAMEKTLFKPATYKGKPVSVVAGTNLRFQAPPTEFVTQILEPTGGKIERPKDWFYSEGGTNSGFLWTISKEDLAKEKQYLTGVRIQMIVGIKEKTGKSPEQFIRDFISTKEKQADEVVDSCEPKEQQFFTRICLQTEEGPFRILYSLFWGNGDLDMAVITIAGTPKDLWAVYASTFDQMSTFELIDAKHLEKKAAESEAAEAAPVEKK